jgi:hypothetical protein
MIQHHITVVLAGAAAHFATGWALNSDMLLGKIWKQEKDKKACTGLSKDMRINLAAQVAASIVLAIATCVALAIFEKAQICGAVKTSLEKVASLFFNKEHAIKSMMNSMHTILFVWAGFILPISAQEVIWCGKSLKHWALESMSDLLCLMSLAAAVTYLS